MKRLTFLEVTHCQAITEEGCLELERFCPKLQIARTTKTKSSEVDASVILEMQEEADRTGPSSGEVVKY